MKPKCPKCEVELDLNHDLRWENIGALGTVAVYYCGKCGSILGVGDGRMHSKKGK